MQIITRTPTSNDVIPVRTSADIPEELCEYHGFIDELRRIDHHAPVLIDYAGVRIMGLLDGKLCELVVLPSEDGGRPEKMEFFLSDFNDALPFGCKVSKLVDALHAAMDEELDADSLSAKELERLRRFNEAIRILNFPMDPPASESSAEPPVPPAGTAPVQDAAAS